MLSADGNSLMVIAPIVKKMAKNGVLHTTQLAKLKIEPEYLFLSLWFLYDLFDHNLCITNQPKQQFFSPNRARFSPYDIFIVLQIDFAVIRDRTMEISWVINS